MIENTKMMKIFKFLEKNGKIQEIHIEVVKLFNDVILEKFIQNNFKDEVESIYSWFYNAYDYELPMYEYNAKNLEIVDILNKLSIQNPSLNVEYKLKLRTIMNFNDQNLTDQDLIVAIETFIKNKQPTLNLIQLSTTSNLPLESKITLNQDVTNLDETKLNLEDKQEDLDFDNSEFGKITETNTSEKEEVSNNEIDFDQEVHKIQDVEDLNTSEISLNKDKSLIQTLILGQIITIISFSLLEIINLTSIFMLSDIISDSAFTPSTFMFILSMIKLVFIFALVGLSIVLLISIGKSDTLKSKILISSIAGISMLVQLLFYGNWLGVSGSIISLFFAIIAICIFFAMYRGAKFNDKESKM